MHSLMQLRQTFNEHSKKNLTAHQIAELAGVPFSVEYLVEIGEHGVYQDEAKKILAAFSNPPKVGQGQYHIQAEVRIV